MGAQPVNGKILPIFLLIACLVPGILGSYKLGEIIVSGQFAPAFASDHVDRLPLLLHMLGSIGFLLLGALQVLPGFRSRHLLWHRRIGKLIALLGLLGALAGLWMTVLHSRISGELLYWGRLGAGTFWTAAIALALAAISRRDFKAHGAWMVRAYAIALPAGTLPFILLPIVLIFGEEGNAFLFDAIQFVAWPVHIAVAEWLVRRRSSRRRMHFHLILSSPQKGA